RALRSLWRHPSHSHRRSQSQNRNPARPWLRREQFLMWVRHRQGTKTFGFQSPPDSPQPAPRGCWFYPLQSVPAYPEDEPAPAILQFFPARTESARRLRTRTASPVFVARKHITVFRALPGFCHHIGHRIAPRLIMRRVPMFGRRLRRPINLHQNKTAWVARILHHIESGDAGFLNTVARVLDSGRAKRFDGFLFNSYVNMDDMH